MRRQGAGDAGSPAERDQHSVRPVHGIDHGTNFVFVCRIDDNVGHPGQFSGPDAQQVDKTFAVGVHYPVEVRGSDVVLTDRHPQRGGQRVVEPGCRHLQVGQQRFEGAGCVEVQADPLHRKRCQLRLVGVVERDTVDSPSPPFLVRDNGHGTS